MLMMLALRITKSFHSLGRTATDTVGSTAAKSDIELGKKSS